ncbi:PREDICTED: uncharacterized protein LOC108765416 isoform X2 [Trachymyrmex cornetzi]|uniref:uncharacterized protein LOC108765416 isoform X2 n=1 Tax=Trachymyrmex cornetzi TaxID=471704 RepID=UPI00084F4322|nr:PREDICTED: uncharacterized protein LOC108765416 isoform X2 [Trachymyrmex cornetzi]
MRNDPLNDDLFQYCDERKVAPMPLMSAQHDLRWWGFRLIGVSKVTFTNYFRESPNPRIQSRPI